MDTALVEPQSRATQLAPRGLDNGAATSASEARATASKLRNIMDNVRNAILLLDRESRVIELNRQARIWFPTLLGTPRPLCDELACHETPDDLHCLGCPIKVCLDTGDTHEGVVNIVVGGREMTARITAFAVEEGEGAVVAILEDVTDQAALAERSRLVQKLESLGLLVGGIVHDLNNTLHVTIGFLDMALGATLEEQVRADLDDARDAALRSAELVQSVLTFGRTKTLYPSVFDVGSRVTGVLRMLRRTIPDNIRIEWAEPPKPIPTLADAARFDQVVLNICVNARDAMPRGGSLALTCFEATLEASECGDGIPLAPGSYACVRVRDDGCGMEPETRARIFEPFFTTKGPRLGTGLGLSSALGVVRQLGGDIRVESELGQGAEFTVWLPLGRAGAHPRIPSQQVDALGSSVGDAGAGRDRRAFSKTVLVVDDEVTIRKLLARVLGAAGHEVLTCDSGRDALAVLEKRGGDIDAALVDVCMPGMGGRDLRELVARRWPKIHVVLMSGQASGDSLEGSAELPVLSKPFSRQGVLRALERP